jgi:hypothetical protein
VQCLLVGGQLLVSCQVLLIYSHLLLQVGQALVSLLLQTPSFLALDLYSLLHVSQCLLKLAHLLSELSLNVLSEGRALVSSMLLLVSVMKPSCSTASCSLSWQFCWSTWLIVVQWFFTVSRIFFRSSAC